jgi:hypothetical protein
MKTSIDRDLLMLAGLVNNHLNQVDKNTDRGGTNPMAQANKLDVESLASSSRGPSRNLANLGYISEQEVRSLVPDPEVSFHQAGLPPSIQPTIHQPEQAQQVPSVITTQIQVNDSYKELADDIKSIKCTLLKIDSTFTKISGMLGKVFNHITSKESTK